MSDKLQRGLSILYDLELNDYMMARAISKLNAEIASLGKAKKIDKPIKQSGESGIFFWISTIAGVTAVIGGIIHAIRTFIETDGFFFRLIAGFAGAIEGALIGALIGIVIGIVVGLIFKSFSGLQAERKFADDCKQYEKDVEMDRYRVKNELARRDFLLKQKDSLVKRRKAATNKLIKYYDTMGIDPKFRNIVPIGYMNEFARLGIAKKLEGVDGLYYLVNKELRYDQFQCSLNDIAYKLDTIVDRQSELYSAVRRIDRQCDQMTNLTIQMSRKNDKLLNQMVDNTSIAAYNSERISRELAFQNFMLYY